MHDLITAAIILALGAGLAACNPTGSCHDCDACSWGEVEPGTMDVQVPGVDADGVAVVHLELQENVCRGQDVVLSRVSYSAGAVTVAAVDDVADTGTDTSKAKTDHAGTFTWSDRDLTMSAEGAGTAVVVLTFTEPGTSLTVSCTAANRVVTCAPE